MKSSRCIDLAPVWIAAWECRCCPDQSGELAAHWRSHGIFHMNMTYPWAEDIVTFDGLLIVGVIEKIRSVPDCLYLGMVNCPKFTPQLCSSTSMRVSSAVYPRRNDKRHDGNYACRSQWAAAFRQATARHNSWSAVKLELHMNASRVIIAIEEQL